jgi:hypothetical protein
MVATFFETCCRNQYQWEMVRTIFYIPLKTLLYSESWWMNQKIRSCTPLQICFYPWLTIFTSSSPNLSTLPTELRRLTPFLHTLSGGPPPYDNWFVWLLHPFILLYFPVKQLKIIPLSSSFGLSHILTTPGYLI